jgi:nucleotide-binding universal stress UspA family protein
MMYRKLLVPLDGSDLAEAAIPHLEEIARGCNVPEILLVSVTEEVKGDVSKSLMSEDTSAREFHMPPAKGQTLPLGSSVTGQTGLYYSSPSAHLAPMPTSMGRMAKTAWNYLSKIAKQLEGKGFSTSVNILVGNPAEQILRFASEKKVDLIIMASRGKSGFNRWDMGNIADKVIRASESAVLLVKPQPGFKETKTRRRGRPT